MRQEILEGIKKYVEPFLLANGFEKTDTDLWGNDYCSIEITNDGYTVKQNEEWEIYHTGHEIYWLVGYLTWYGFIPKNYNKPA